MRGYEDWTASYSLEKDGWNQEAETEEHSHQQFHFYLNENWRTGQLQKRKEITYKIAYGFARY